MRSRSRAFDTGLAAVAVSAPVLALLELSTPMLIARPPSYRELETAWLARTPLVRAGVAAALGWACGRREGGVLTGIVLILPFLSVT